MILDKIKRFFRLGKKDGRTPFSALGLDAKTVAKLAEHNFTTATEVQRRAIPVALSGKNIFCSSETGSGKTLAFLLPLIEKLHQKQIHQALIICPTREIAIQVNKELQRFKDDSLTSALVIGGTNMEQQKKALREYPKILVSTPGRLLDMLSTGYIWLDYTDYVVLDEADRMLDMGFEEDLVQIQSHLPGNHQTVLFSATLFPEVKKLAERYASDYHEITIGNPTKVANTVEHVAVELNERDKLSALKYLIRNSSGKVIVFFNSINSTSNITAKLTRTGMKDVDCLHSKIKQAYREAIIRDYRSGEIRVLLASDIASRGIDIPNVNLVINYDVPYAPEEYIHRVGRTGRGGNSGMAISFLSRHDQEKIEAIEDLLGSEIEREPSYRNLI